MARKKITVGFEAPITLLFSIISIGVFLVQFFSSQNFVDIYFSVGGNASSATPFDRTSLFDYISILTHVFAHTSVPTFVIHTLCILFLGPQIEASYGKGLYILMITITAFISGVFSTLFVSTQLIGSQGIVVLFFILTILAHAKTKTVSCSIIIAFLLQIFFTFENSNASFSEKIIPFIGALCGSVFGFIDFFEQTKPTPRKRKTTVQ